VVASLRLENMADQAVSSSFMVRVIQEKAPEKRNFARIADDGLEE